MAIEQVEPINSRSPSSEVEKTYSADIKGVSSETEDVNTRTSQQDGYVSHAPPEKKKWWHSVKKRGSATQIVIAALLAIAIGVPIALTVDDIPKEVQPILGIPGNLWLRALKAIVIPLIVCSMILAVQKLREISSGGSILARWTLGYYICTTIVAIVLSCIMTALVWGPMFTEASAGQLQKDGTIEYPDESENPIHMVIVQMFESLVSDNIVKSLAENQLLAVLVASVVVGYCIEGPDSSLLKAVVEVEKIVTRVITVIMEWTPLGVFSLILSNLMQLDVAEAGKNMGILIAGTLGTMFIHLFVVIPIIFFFLAKMNPYSFWLKNSPAWITAWGSASSAATLPVTLRCARDRGVPKTIRKFAIPLGCLINMDGTAIYFPMTVVFLARTQGISLGPVDYVIITLAATLSSIGTTPIPSSSLVLSVMIAGLVNVPVTGMYGVILAIDWLLDRFRTALNISGDLYGAMVVYKKTGIEDDEEDDDDMDPAMARDDRV